VICFLGAFTAAFGTFDLFVVVDDQSKMDRRKRFKHLLERTIFNIVKIVKNRAIQYVLAKPQAHITSGYCHDQKNKLSK